MLDGMMRKKALSSEEFTRLFLYRRTMDFQVLLNLTILAGLSFEEVSNLTWNDVDLKRKIICMGEHSYEIVPSMEIYLKEYRTRKLEEFFEKNMLDQFRFVYCGKEGEKYTSEELKEQFTEYLKEHSVSDMSPSDIHKSFPETLYKKDLVSEVIKQFTSNIRLHPVYQKKWAQQSGQCQ